MQKLQYFGRASEWLPHSDNSSESIQVLSANAVCFVILGIIPVIKIELSRAMCEFSTNISSHALIFVSTFVGSIRARGILMRWNCIVNCMSQTFLLILSYETQIWWYRVRKRWWMERNGPSNSDDVCTDIISMNEFHFERVIVSTKVYRH